MAQSRNWCFTQHVDLDTEILLGAPEIDPRSCSFLVAQLERCPTTAQVHWQGYCHFSKNMRLAALKKLAPTAHWEPCKGNSEQNIKYCTKEESRVPGTEPVTYGEPPKPGRRTDLDEFAAAIKEGKRARTLVSEGFLPLLARYPKLYQNLVAMTRPPVNPEKKVVLFYGKPGVGKTRFVYDKHGASDEFYATPLSNGTPWFDGYDSHKFALLDDFDGAASKIPLTQTLKLLDIYPIQVPTKGGHTWWNPEVLYITTNLRPTDWYDFTSREVQYKALLRRIHEAHCWDPETGDSVVLKTQLEISSYFPFVPKPPPEVRIYK